MDNDFNMNSSDWDYAILSKSAHESGGPEYYVHELYNNGYADGFSDGFSDAQAACVTNTTPAVGNEVVVVLVTAVTTLLGLAACAWVWSKIKKKRLNV